MPEIDDDGRELPSGAPQWLPLIAFWPTFDEAAFAAVTTCFGVEQPTSWDEFRTWVVASGVAEADASAGVQARPEWVPVLELAMHALLDDPESQMKVFHGCQPGTNWRLAVTFATWARHSGRWELLQAIWWLRRAGRGRPGGDDADLLRPARRGTKRVPGADLDLSGRRG